MQQVWKIPLNPQREPDFLYTREEPDKFVPNKAEKARAFCFSEGWVGIGWGIGIDRDLTDHNEYIVALEHGTERELGFPPTAATGPCLALAVKMQRGDFVWCRANADVYWLGKVSGPWNYRHDGDFDQFDVYQVRKCQWVCVGPSDLVPGPVKNAYAGRGQAISCILKESEAAFLGSALIWESKTGEKIGSYPKPVNEYPLGAIAHDDLEDIVALYIQMEMGWHVIPSTVKRSTPVTEFVLRNRAGKRAYLQVKSGQAQIDYSVIKIPTDVDFFFVFYPTIMEPAKSAHADVKLVHIRVWTHNLIQ